MKVIIKDIMNENRGNDLIDRVVKFLIDGTTYTVFSNYLGSKKDVVDVYIPFFQSSYEIDLDDSYDWFNRYNKKLYTVDGDALEYMDNYFGITNVDTIRNIVINYYDIMYKEVERLLMDIDNTPNNTINENINRTQRFINKISEILNPPYFRNLELYDVPEELWDEIFSIVFNREVKNRWFNKIFDNNNKLIYEEDDGHWVKREFDSNEKELYYEDSDGYWEKKEYDSNGNRIYYENSDGHWIKREFDSNNNELYYEDSDGNWEKFEYDSNGKEIYYENSNGEIIDRRNNINENINRTQKFINKVSEILEVPYFKNLELYDVPEELWNDIFSIVFNKEVKNRWFNKIIDSKNNELYYENSNGFWKIYKYDNNNNEIYYEDSNGYWEKREYDSNNNELYFESSNGEIIDGRN